MEMVTISYGRFFWILWICFCLMGHLIYTLVFLIYRIIKGWPYRSVMKKFKQISRNEHRRPIDQEYLIIEKFVDEYEREQLKKFTTSKDPTYEEWKAAREEQKHPEG